MSEQTETRLKMGRGKAQRSLDLIAAMCEAAEAAQPITGRGIGYKLFAAGADPLDGQGGDAARLPPA